jgi:hypothetical protein
MPHLPSTETNWQNITATEKTLFWTNVRNTNAPFSILHLKAVMKLQPYERTIASGASAHGDMPSASRAPSLEQPGYSDCDPNCGCCG